MRVIFTLAAICLANFLACAQVNLTSGLVAYYPFNGTANDASGNNHHGQMMNGIQLTTDRFGNPNSAFLFDGIDDYISIKDDGSFSTSHFSLVLWFQTSSDALQNLVAKRDYSTVAFTGGAQYQFFINYPPYPGIGSNIVSNTSTCTNIPTSSYINTADWICKEKWHNAVITFDGARHKIYIDGILKKDEATTFNGMLTTCKSDLRFGNWFIADMLSFKGKMDDIRWYNRPLNQNEVITLYANYPKLVGVCSPTTNTSFLTPDTVCVNTPVQIANTSVGAGNFYWNFCVANSSSNPVGTNLGNFGFSLSVFIDYAKDGDNYYAFVTNNTPGKLVRLDFGNSLLNTPTAHDFGNLGGVIPSLCEGIQVVKNEGRWYAIIVGGSPVGRIVKVDFGTTLSNNAPIATNWGNIGDIAYPVDLHLFQSGDKWYGLTINAHTSTITRFDFTASFSNTPTGTNFGNIGGLNYPTGIFAVSRNGTWHAFVSNAGSGDGNSTNSSLTRLDFGNSLLNTPTGTNLGNPGGTLSSARDITLYQSCDEIFGFVINYSTANDIVRLNFNNSLTSVPSAVSIGNTGGLSFPHGLSKLFRVENDLYSFIANVNNNSITRLKFEGCNSASIANSTEEIPPAITYDRPGVYNINLTTNEGLSTQGSFCKQVVVLSATHTPLQSKSICSGDSVLLTSTSATGNNWNTGSTSNSIYAKQPGMYWVQSVNAGGCVNTDSFSLAVKPYPVVNLGKDTAICDNASLLLQAVNAGATYLWQNGQTGATINVQQPGLYHVTVTKEGCTAKDSVNISLLSLPVTSIMGQTVICKEGKTNLTASGGTAYTWFPSTGLSTASGASTTASPQSTTKYVVSVANEYGCTAKDSIIINVTPKPVFTAFSSKPVLCLGDTVSLTASGADSYAWTPSTSVLSPDSPSTAAYPTVSTRFKVVMEEARCGLKDSLYIHLPVVDKPSVQTTKSNDITCFIRQATLSTGGGRLYLWQPSTGLSDSTSSKPTVRINKTTTYQVQVTTAEGCQVKDSVTVYVNGGNDGSGFPVAGAFSPNGDGTNDYFGVRHWGAVDNFSLQLFNRWGELVFQTNNPAICWNGEYKGQPQPVDTYVYIVKAKTSCGAISRKGTFTLIR